MNKEINNAFLQLSKRAEAYDKSHLVDTFVDAGPLFTSLINRDHQILYGRRGTGKTHAFAYLADRIESLGDIVITIDMRTIGSTGGIYADPELPLSERATRLLADTLAAIHDGIFAFVIDHDLEINLSTVGPLLDNFADAITEVAVVGTVKQETAEGEINKSEDIQSLGASVSKGEGKLDISQKYIETSQRAQERKSLRDGVERHRIHFGSVHNVLSNIMNTLNEKRLWILLDEWSEIPHDLQPYLADLLRRSIFPVNKISVKIAAIEQRCRFRIASPEGAYIGIEVGADAATSLNLDEFMVFDNNAENSKDFFRELVYRHVKSVIGDNPEFPTSSHELIRVAFTQRTVFEEFVKASEGVPRDAINILSLAAQRANENPISIYDIRHAAKSCYNRTKENAVSVRPDAQLLLHWIVDEVIGHRRARAFLLRSDIRNELIDYLFDARILHVIKHGVSSHDEPGVRYNVYCIDYGCYVDLINTSRAPKGLFEVETCEGVEYVEVPANDYRSIRRAILKIDRFEELHKDSDFCLKS